MIFGQPSDFAIEAYHEPSGPQWGGYGRMALEIQGVRLGDIRENHCSLFHAAERFRQLNQTIETLWDASFTGLSDAEIFSLVDHALYTGEPSECGSDFCHFDFLTNTGEQFNAVKTYIACHPDGYVRLLYLRSNGVEGAVSCQVSSFRHVAESFVNWFDEQVRTTAPPYFPVQPFHST